VLADVDEQLLKHPEAHADLWEEKIQRERAMRDEQVDASARQRTEQEIEQVQGELDRLVALIVRHGRHDHQQGDHHPGFPARGAPR